MSTYRAVRKLGMGSLVLFATLLVVSGEVGYLDVLPAPFRLVLLAPYVLLPALAFYEWRSRAYQLVAAGLVIFALMSVPSIPLNGHVKEILYVLASAPVVIGGFLCLPGLYSWRSSPSLTRIPYPDALQLQSAHGPPVSTAVGPALYTELMVIMVSFLIVAACVVVYSSVVEGTVDVGGDTWYGAVVVEDASATWANSGPLARVPLPTTALERGDTTQPSRESTSVAPSGRFIARFPEGPPRP